MRRSEALEEINNCLLRFYNSPPKDLRDMLLNVIEDMGMLPPDREPLRNEFESEDAYVCTLEEKHIYGLNLGWEPEDD